MKQPATFIKNVGCNAGAGEFPDLDWCWTCPGSSIRDIAHIESNQACVVPARTEVQHATFIDRVACGRLDERACALVGRPSCDTNHVEFNNICRGNGDCGTEGKRRCLLGESGTWEPLTGCAITLVPTNDVCTHPACGRLDEQACAIVGRLSCDPGLVEFNNMCRRDGDCGTEGKRRCLAGEPGTWEPLTGCAITLVPTNDVCTHPPCGRLDEQACAIAGRLSCDPGLVEFKKMCRTSGDCGTAGKRPCLLGEPGTWELSTGCAKMLVPKDNVCLPDCGRLNQRACAILGRLSCDPDLVEYENMCHKKGDCGAEGQRRCLLGEPSPGCSRGLSDRDGRCHTCGGLGQWACVVVGRSACNSGLVEANGLCFTRAACGTAEQRACLMGERNGPSCNSGSFENAGMCIKCGAAGERACSIPGRKSCNSGLVEFKDMCFPRGQCGATRQRVCLIGETARAGCAQGLTAQDGVCVTPVAATPPPPGPLFAFVRTDPPAPALTPGSSVTIIASSHDGTTKQKRFVDTIEIFQANYAGPGSKAPALIKTCPKVEECKFTLPSSSSRSTSYRARVVLGSDSFTTPIRVTDLKFSVSPIRVNVSAEEVAGSNKIALVPYKRAVDIIFFAGTGYPLTTTMGKSAFSDRLKDELATMLGVAPLPRLSSLADNLSAVSFYVSPAPAVVKRGDGLVGMCEHSTSGPIAWGDAQGILHPNLPCRDWSVPGPFYSAKDPSTSWHEMHHAAFQMSDEYCEGTVHSQRVKFPNVYNSKAECGSKSSYAATCTRIATPEGCNDPDCKCSTSYWRSDPANDVMQNNSIEQADDMRATNGKFDECKAGGC